MVKMSSDKSKLAIDEIYFLAQDCAAFRKYFLAYFVSQKYFLTTCSYFAKNNFLINHCYQI